jgi:dihydrofolate reductase
MVEIIYGVAASLDGFIAPRDGSADWLQPFGAAGMDHVAEFLKSVDAIVMGSRTYEQMLTLEGPGWFNKPGFVLSSRQLPALNSDIVITKMTPAEFVADMEQRGIQRVWHFGGAILFEAFREAGLITGYSLGIVPVVLGDGMPLFKSPARPANLKLTKSRAHPSGVLLVDYQVGR